MSKKIGFKMARDEQFEEAPQQIDDKLLVELLQTMLNPPDWEDAYAQTLFWAVVFGTEQKIVEA